MACIAISASLQSACSSHRITKKPQPQTRPARSLGSKQVTHVSSALNVEDQKKGLRVAEQQEKSPFHADESKNASDKSDYGSETESSAPKFVDDQAKRRKFLEFYPEASTNEEPVLFRSSVIPWWAWLKRSYLPEAELINGRAAMVGFFMSCIVDALTGLDMVSQTGNLLCKAGLFVTVISILLLRRTEDFDNLRKLADEATLYDKQWQASWQDQNAPSTGASEKTGT
ncbi:hypothetical protein P3X46_030735 [Hevea brasiliensis]|uniref:Uncharacterized protein n=1 Tax=Hevea brasiliensis TaxID=3981 RepID=A0ABQ9KI42_HEVBR|nr:hypothetical protein P3X46_030735 [Hevea brasiliensis]